MNRSYEIMFIVRPDVEEAELDKLIARLDNYKTVDRHLNGTAMH